VPKNRATNPELQREYSQEMDRKNKLSPVFRDGLVLLMLIAILALLILVWLFVDEGMR
jgi:hypothetical protein